MSIVPDSTSLHSGQSKGAIVTAAFSVLSALAFLFVGYRCTRLVLHKGSQGTYGAPENLLFRTHIGHYVGSLLVGNVFLTLAGLIEFKWGIQSRVTRGALCSTQAAMMEIGLWSSGFFTVATGMHTCISLVFRARQVPWINLACIVLGWIISFVVALVPLEKSNAYGPEGISCGVMRDYKAELFVLQPLPILMGIACSGAIYSLIFFVLYGKLSPKNGDLEMNSQSQHRWSLLYDSREYVRFIAVLAQTMFWYPFAFFVLLLPFCVTRLLIYSGSSLSDSSDVFARVCCSMLGLANVGLLYNTFRVVSPLFKAPLAVKVAVETEKSFGNSASQESPIRPEPAYMPRRDVLPPPFHQNHNRSESESSADSATQLLGVKRKSSKYNGMRVRQAGQPSISALSNQGKAALTIAVPPPSVGLLSPPLVTVRLSAVPSFPTSNESHSNSSGRDEADASGGPGYKGKAPTPLVLCDELAAFPPVPLSAYHVSNKSATLASRLGLPTPSPAIRPSSRYIVPFSASLQPATPQPLSTKLDKGKGKAPSLPETPIPHISITAPDAVHHPPSSIRPLPSLPESVDSDGFSCYSSSESSSSYSEGEKCHVPRASSQHSALRPLPAVPPLNDGDITDAEWPCTPGPSTRSVSRTSNRSEDTGSRRTTISSVWSQDSAWTKSQPPDHEAILAYSQLVPHAVIPGHERANVGSVAAKPTKRAVSPATPRSSTLRGMRPVKLASRLTVRFAGAIKGPVSPSGFTIVNAPNNDSATG
ncbi:hypothetical protein EDD16DRAFT_1572465 [Pisolithus croceorrhizus]|nr:hypothetical protein EDD16DRAFT_1572465 [Pisolithus croceorrhizus]